MNYSFRHIALCISLLACLTMQGQLLYRISGNGCSSPSYIFATNKLTDISFLDTIPSLFASYGRTERVITEFAIEDYEAMQALRSAALLPDSVQLKNFLTDEEYKRVDESLELALGMGLEQLGRMKPQYLTEMYRTELLRKWAGYSDERSSEHFFEAVASSQGKPVIGLDDTGEAMYMLFDREPFHWQCSELVKVVDYPEREVQLEKKIAALYREGRLLDIAYLVSGPDNQSTLSYSDYQVYKQRNRTWVKRLKPYLKQGGCFIVLNAIYLGGDEGLLQQLRAAGYKVK